MLESRAVDLRNIPIGMCSNHPPIGVPNTRCSTPRSVRCAAAARPYGPAPITTAPTSWFAGTGERLRAGPDRSEIAAPVGDVLGTHDPAERRAEPAKAPLPHPEHGRQPGVRAYIFGQCMGGFQQGRVPCPVCGSTFGVG